MSKVEKTRVDTKAILAEKGLAKWLKDEIDRLGLTQAQVADGCSLKVSRISNIALGHYAAEDDELESIAAWLSMQPGNSEDVQMWHVAVVAGRNADVFNGVRFRLFKRTGRTRTVVAPVSQPEPPPYPSLEQFVENVATVPVPTLPKAETVSIQINGLNVQGSAGDLRRLLGVA